MFGDGTSERGYTYVDDLVDGIWAAWRYIESKHTGTFDIFNLGGSEAISLQELISKIEKEMGLSAIIIREPEQIGDVPRTLADNSKARSVLGYEPDVPFSEGLNRFINWYRGSMQASM